MSIETKFFRPFQENTPISFRVFLAWQEQARTRLKNVLMDALCHEHIPAKLVTLGFRIFRLRNL